MERRPMANFLIATCVAGSFVLGLNFSAFGAQVPERVVTRVTGSRDLEPLNAYNTALRELKERFYGELPSDTKLTYAAVRGMLAAVDDPYTRFLEPTEYKALHEENQGEIVGIGVLIEPQPTKEGFIRVSRPLVGGPAIQAGIQKADLITKVDGKSVVGMTVDQVVKLIRGQADTPVRLTIQRPGKPDPMELKIVRQLVEIEVVESEMKEGNIGYIFLAQFNQRADEKVEAAIRDLKQKGMKGLVLDLRGNPGGLLESAVDIVSRFLPGRNTACVLVESGGQQQARRVNPDYPIVILINGSSASASEIVAGAFKDHKLGTLVGQTTYGKGLVQTVLPRPQDGSAVMITTQKYLTSKGTDINRTRQRRGGVAPDIEVEITEADFVARRDTQLNKALEILHQKTGYVKPAAPNAAASAGQTAPKP